jgi:glycosyltransferase involved in cell wall biosynthesis
VKTAYLLFTYPALSQTFVVDEVRGVRDAGLDVQTWALNPPGSAALGTQRNREEAGRTRTLKPVAWRAMARAHLRALRVSPAGYLRTLGRALADRPPGFRAALLGLAAFAAAIRMWDQLEREGVRHLHVHYAGTPTHVAMLLCSFGDAARREGPEWTWSVTVHGPVEFEDGTGLRLAERVGQALFVVAISDFARSQLLKLLPATEWDKVRVVRCGVDIDSFPVSQATGAADELRVLYVGTLIERKGQPVLLEAFARLVAGGVAARLTLVGQGPRRAELERMAQDLGVADTVTFTGGLDHDRVREEYTRTDVFCLPSFAEGLPVVLMEAMASGLPVVSTRIAGIPELVEDGEHGFLVRPGRADDLEQALARLAAEPELRRRMGALAQAKVARDHDRGRVGRELADLHREFRA